jgi:hypothetical protein
MAVPSKARSSASVNLAVGSPKNRICKILAQNHLYFFSIQTVDGQGQKKLNEIVGLTPELPVGSRASPQALVLQKVSII